MTPRTWMFLLIMLSGFAIGIYQNAPNTWTLAFMILLVAAAIILIVYNIVLKIRNKKRSR